MSEEQIDVTQLGQKSEIASSPEEAVLEAVPNPQRGEVFVTRFTCPEFTSLCPVTGQPDFAHLIIDYVPAEKLVESKSLKLFLQSFRNHGAFHEDCTVTIGRRIVAAIEPRWLRIGGYWYPRGGIPIDIFWQSGPEPRGGMAAPAKCAELSRTWVSGNVSAKSASWIDDRRLSHSR